MLKESVPVGSPLAWPVVDSGGALLLSAGTILPAVEQRDFLFEHFRPCRAGPDSDGPPNARDAVQGHAQSAVTLDDMHLMIGALLGIRSRIGIGREMQQSRLIGISPGRALFVTPPLVGRRPVVFALGESVEIVALASQAVFLFVCTIEAVCQHPFDYLVLSRPGQIRRLRERRAIRVRTRLATRYGVDLTGNTLDGLGIGRDLSVLGMSLSASLPLGHVGERLCVAFQIRTRDLDVEFQAVAVIRNVQHHAGSGSLATHGLEFDPMSAEQQFVLKSFVFDHQDATAYWAGMDA
ncbi:flagellar brake protein [Paraburkholderia sp. MM5384-R2]|uniref:flagellar brake protein n=1 Tax=Paraburkholderia sp. MM5384-R2 TaxID=2723097 RepID=UPI0021A8BEEB|nr:flagellar brake protein [Paraburkholderia sp. MM5384-R2]